MNATNQLPDYLSLEFAWQIWVAECLKSGSSFRLGDGAHAGYLSFHDWQWQGYGDYLQGPRQQITMDQWSKMTARQSANTLFQARPEAKLFGAGWALHDVSWVRIATRTCTHT